MSFKTELQEWDVCEDNLRGILCETGPWVYFSDFTDVLGKTYKLSNR